MADNSNATEYSASTFWMARNFRTSARLHLQHLLFQNTLSFLLEPRIEKSLQSAKDLKVADLACGNGIWLCDLDRELSAKGVAAKLDGFDINPINFPPAHLLPESVKLHTLDVTAKPLPQELVGAYDVVHVRAFISIIVKENLEPLLSTALALLKPGGWLQWEETRVDKWRADAPSADANAKTACDTILSIINAGGAARGVTYGFVGELDKHLKEFGFEDVAVLQVEKRKPDLKAWTEDYLMVWEELGMFFPSKATAPQAPMTKEGYATLFNAAVHETEQAVVVHQDSVLVAVGRKAG